jgi:hypothetical protein
MGIEATVSALQVIPCQQSVSDGER